MSRIDIFVPGSNKSVSAFLGDVLLVQMNTSFTDDLVVNKFDFYSG